MNYELMQNDPILKIWHCDLPEVIKGGFDIKSPYSKTTPMDIEIDCCCTDICNLWES